MDVIHASSTTHVILKFENESPADVGILQCKSKLDSQESKTHVPDFPKT